ncbi:hypothetical protein BDR26DRAFT_51086 [Obelidium mucronatum]|nr:hypothetical protein BDR26DRAFT_51086 [Obelidium mucronatum]
MMSLGFERGLPPKIPWKSGFNNPTPACPHPPTTSTAAAAATTSPSSSSPSAKDERVPFSESFMKTELGAPKSRSVSVAAAASSPPLASTTASNVSKPSALMKQSSLPDINSSASATGPPRPLASLYEHFSLKVLNLRSGGKLDSASDEHVAEPTSLRPLSVNTAIGSATTLVDSDIDGEEVYRDDFEDLEEGEEEDEDASSLDGDGVQPSNKLPLAASANTVGSSAGEKKKKKKKKKNKKGKKKASSGSVVPSSVFGGVNGFEVLRGIDTESGVVEAVAPAVAVTTTVMRAKVVATNIAVTKSGTSGSVVENKESHSSEVPKPVSTPKTPDVPVALSNVPSAAATASVTGPPSAVEKTGKKRG